MSTPSPTPFRSRARLALGLAALAAAAWALPARAAEEAPSLSEKTSEAFGRIQPLWDAKNWDGVLAELDTLVPTLDPEGYDMAYVQFNRAKMLIEKDRLLDSVVPLEKALHIVDGHPNYVGSGPPLGHEEVNQIVGLLAQLYAQKAGDEKNPSAQHELYAKALEFFRRALHNATRPSEDMQYSYSALLLSQATADAKNVDQAGLREAGTEIHKGLTMTAHPKEQFYILAAYVLQQQENYVEAAKYTELLVKLFPKKKEYWTQLWLLYNNLAAQEKDEHKLQAYYAREINTFERAKTLGFLNTPKDKYNELIVYYNSGQFRLFTELLDAGLGDGSVDAAEVKNWELLAYSYQQINDYTNALRTYRTAEEHFPENGNLDVSMAQIHTQLDDTEAAYEDYKRAVSKPHLEHAFEIYRAIAYAAYMLGEDKGDGKMYEAALKAMDDGAERFPKEAAKDKNWGQLRTVIQDTIKHLALVHASVEASQNQR